MLFDSTEFALAHAAARDALLERIVAALRADERFVAAWLRGGFSGAATTTRSATWTWTWFCAMPMRRALCARPWQTGGAHHMSGRNYLAASARPLS